MQQLGKERYFSGLQNKLKDVVEVTLVSNKRLGNVCQTFFSTSGDVFIRRCPEVKVLSLKDVYRRIFQTSDNKRLTDVFKQPPGDVRETENTDHDVCMTSD